MHYIFSNVYRFEEDAEFVEKLGNVGFAKGDTIVFLNDAVPFDHARDFFLQFNLTSFHRWNAVSGKEGGLDAMNSRKKQSKSLSSALSSFKIDNEGKVTDEGGLTVGAVEFGDYPKGKIPTTGFLVARFFRECRGEDVTLVNFYGSEDSSTGKWAGHDWISEEIALRESYDIIFMDRDGVRHAEKPRKRRAGEIGVSVVVPVHDVAEYLPECLDSLVRQTLKDIEIICVDDGSSDKSGEIAESYAARDDRFKVVRQENLGLSVARNKGMSLAKGEYVYFLDGDDWLEPDALERLLRISDGLRLDQLIFSAQVFCDDAYKEEKADDRRQAMDRYYHIPPQVANRRMLGVSLLERLIDNRAFAASATLRLFRRAYLENAKVLFPAGLLHEDEYFTPVSMVVAGMSMAIEDRFYHRRIRPGSITIARDMVRKRIQSYYAIAMALKDYANACCRKGSLEGRLLLDRSDKIETAMISLSETISLADVPDDCKNALLDGYRRARRSQQKTGHELQTLTKNLEAVRAVRDAALKERDVLRGTLDSVRKVRDAALKERDVLRGTLDSVRKMRDAALKERDTLRSVLDATRTVRDAALQERDVLRGTLDSVRKVRDAALKERDTLRRGLDATRTVRDAALKERNSLRNTLDAVRTVRDAVITERNALRGKVASLSKACDAAQAERDAVGRELSALRDLRDKIFQICAEE